MFPITKLKREMQDMMRLRKLLTSAGSHLIRLHARRALLFQFGVMNARTLYLLSLSSISKSTSRPLRTIDSISLFWCTLRPSFGISLRSWRTAHRLLILLLIISVIQIFQEIGVFLLSRNSFELTGSLREPLFQFIDEFGSRKKIPHANAETHLDVQIRVSSTNTWFLEKGDQGMMEMEEATKYDDGWGGWALVQDGKDLQCSLVRD